MSGQAADCHGCLVCHSVKRPWRCADCVNQALNEKRQFSDEAQTRSEAARSALAAALQVASTAWQLQLQLPTNTTVTVHAARKRAHKHARLAAVIKQVPGSQAQ